jgi:hypothetical protein
MQKPVPVARNFPAAPDELMQECPDLKSVPEGTSRLSEEYKNSLLNMFKVGFPVGKLYLRIFSGELRKPIKLFWLKELLYTLKDTTKIPFLKGAERILEWKRSVSQMRYFLTTRSEYDKTYHKLLIIYKSLNPGK